MTLKLTRLKLNKMEERQNIFCRSSILFGVLFAPMNHRIFFFCGQPAANMPFRFVFVQDMFYSVCEDVYKRQLLQSLFDLRRFADSAAEVIELRPSDFTFPNNLDLGHARAVDGENPLHTDAIGQTAHRERLIDAAVLLCNDRAFENLKAFSGALLDFDVHFHRVADVEAERVFPDILLEMCIRDRS